MNLKTIDHNLKVLLSIGGTNHKSTGFTDMVKTKESRNKFIIEAWKFLLLHSKDLLIIKTFYKIILRKIQKIQDPKSSDIL